MLKAGEVYFSIFVVLSCLLILENFQIQSVQMGFPNSIHAKYKMYKLRIPGAGCFLCTKGIFYSYTANPCIINLQDLF